MGKYAIYERTFRISSFGLTCFANSKLTGTYIYWYFTCFQVSEGEKKIKRVTTTSLRRNSSERS